MLLAGPAENLDISDANGRTLDPTGEAPVPGASLYQIVQETARGTRFLTSWDDLEAAMENARSLNANTGLAYKVVMWGTGKAVLRPEPSRQFRGDNILPSYVYHPAAVKTHPEALPVSAVYGKRSEVIFTPTGDGIVTNLGSFAVGVGDAAVQNIGKSMRGAGAGISLPGAIAAARQVSSKRRQRATVFARARGRLHPVLTVAPTVQEEGLGEYGFGSVIRPVTPREYEELLRMQ